MRPRSSRSMVVFALRLRRPGPPPPDHLRVPLHRHPALRPRRSSVLSLLILEMKPAAFYLAVRGGPEAHRRCGSTTSSTGCRSRSSTLFGASVIASTLLRWPVKLKGRAPDLPPRPSRLARRRRRLRDHRDPRPPSACTTASTPHVPVQRRQASHWRGAALGFDLHLSRFEHVNYEPEYRVGYYEEVTVTTSTGSTRTGGSRRASIRPREAPAPERRLLPAQGIYPDFRPVPDPAAQQVAYGTTSKNGSTRPSIEVTWAAFRGA